MDTQRKGRLPRQPIEYRDGERVYRSAEELPEEYRSFLADRERMIRVLVETEGLDPSEAAKLPDWALYLMIRNRPELLGALPADGQDRMRLEGRAAFLGKLFRAAAWIGGILVFFALVFAVVSSLLQPSISQPIRR